MPTEPGSEAQRIHLDPRTVTLVQETAALLHSIADAAATLFYGRLFALDPSLRGMFSEDADEQKKRLLQALGVLVNGIREPEAMRPLLEQLGVRHVGYMVTDRHYDLFGEALLWTLQEGLGDAFSDEAEIAWMEVYGLVAGVMKRAASAGPASVSAARASLRPSFFAAAFAPPPTPRAGALSAGAHLAKTQTSTIRPPASVRASVNGAESHRPRPPSASADPGGASTAMVNGLRAVRGAGGQEVTVNLRVAVDIESAAQRAVERAVEHVAEQVARRAAERASEHAAEHTRALLSPVTAKAPSSRGSSPSSSRESSPPSSSRESSPPSSSRESSPSSSRARGPSHASPSLLRAFPASLLLLVAVLPMLSAGTAALTLVLLAGPAREGVGAAVGASLAASLLVSLALVAGYLAGVSTRGGGGAAQADARPRPGRAAPPEGSEG